MNTSLLLRLESSRCSPVIGYRFHSVRFSTDRYSRAGRVPHTDRCFRASRLRTAAVVRAGGGPAGPVAAETVAAVGRAAEERGGTATMRLRGADTFAGKEIEVPEIAD
jgi:hypothetical protein